jgi:arylsulfatase A-like enzyme
LPSAFAPGASIATRWLLFTSDNGPHQEGGADPEYFTSSGRLRGVKRDLYEGGIRVPARSRAGRGTIPAGRVSDTPWAHWDMFPTLAGIAGANTPPASTGRRWCARCAASRSPSMRRSTGSSTSAASSRPRAWANGRPSASRRTRPLELYDLRQDPREAANVAAANPDVVKRPGYLESARTMSALADQVYAGADAPA